MASRLLVLLAAIPLLVACGDSASEGTSATSGAGGSASAATTTSASSTTGGGAVPTLHRETAPVCSNDRPPGSIGAGPDGTCVADAECTEGDNGRCVQRLGQPTFCSYDECSVDADCGAASVCECRNPSVFNANVCVHGNCVLDADCGPSGYCSPSAVTLDPSCAEGVSPGSVGYFCHTPEDECVDAADCGASPESAACIYQVAEQRFACFTLMCVL